MAYGVRSKQFENNCLAKEQNMQSSRTKMCFTTLLLHQEPKRVHPWSCPKQITPAPLSSVWVYIYAYTATLLGS